MSGKSTVVGSVLMMGFGMWMSTFILWALIGMFLAIVFGIVLAICLIGLIGWLIVSSIRGETVKESRIVLALFVGMALVSLVLILMIRSSGPAVPEPGLGALLVLVLLFWLWLASFMLTLDGMVVIINGDKLDASNVLWMTTFVLMTSLFVGFWGAPVA